MNSFTLRSLSKQQGYLNFAKLCVELRGDKEYLTTEKLSQMAYQFGVTYRIVDEDRSRDRWDIVEFYSEIYPHLELRISREVSVREAEFVIETSHVNLVMAWLKRKLIEENS